VKTYTKALIPRAKTMRRAMTRAETKLWLDFLHNHPTKVRRQRPFGGFIVDFYCAATKTVIEVDGESHFSQAGLEYDQERTAFLEGLGLTVVRVTNHQVIHEFETVCQMLEAHLKSPPAVR
jgi:very-short-patch-repair endonuclease